MPETKIKISDIKINPANPRLIKDARFRKLVKSIEEFPKMMALRQIIVDNDNMVLGGNMRLKALQELKYKTIPAEWVKNANELTEDEKRRFIIADNVDFGEHDWDMLANEWDQDELIEWGVEIPIYEDFSEKNKEIDTDEFSDKMELKFEVTGEEYQYIQSELSKIDANKENALLKILGYEP